MTKVTLLGDSIRMNYENEVRKQLGDDFEVYTSSENGRWASFTRRSLYDQRDKIAQSRVIHWNNGHWDICDLFGNGPFTDEKVYVNELRMIAELLLKITPKVIFATTTPLKEGNKHNDNPTTDRYNRLAVETLAPMGIVINDLNAAVKQNVDLYICEDRIHLTDEGIRLCGKLVAEKIKEVL